MRPAILCAAAMGLVAAAAAEEVSFTAGPHAKRQGEHVAITFTVSKPTDVTVSILDDRGSVVRHLVAGVLGANAPAPFKKGSLSQEILWDGKGDSGQPVRGAKAMLRLGLKIGSVKVASTGFELPPRVKATNKPPPPIDAGKMFDVLSEDYSGNWSLRLAGDPDTGAIYYRRNSWSKWYLCEVSGGRDGRSGQRHCIRHDTSPNSYVAIPSRHFSYGNH